MSAVVFHRPLNLTSTGRDVVAVKRALSRAGVLKWSGFTPFYGLLTANAMGKFQRQHNITVTGAYNEKTHTALVAFMDKVAVRLYESASKKPAAPVESPHDPPQVNGILHLHRRFVPTHQTAGLPGYPAIDEFAPPGTKVASPDTGFVTRLSGHDPKLGGKPGCAYGWSIYLRADDGRTHYMTHLGSRTVKVGDRVKMGEIIGTVCDSAVSGKPGTSHIHHGIH